MEGDPRNPRVSLLKKYDIPIDHLSYEYIEKCADKKELERIIRILRSGEEGSYPDLLKVTEERLRFFAPDSRVLRVETPILTKDLLPNDEWSAVENELLSWENEMKIMDKSLDFEKSRIETVGNKNMPDIRKVNQPVVKNEKVNNTKTVNNLKNERIKSNDYSAWDKFDVDKELHRMDIEEERKQEEKEKRERIMKKQMKTNKIEIVEPDKESFSSMEQQVLANQAKDRGNECYKSGDLENALKYYDISIKLHETANAFNNRAMTYLKLKQYENAVKDCNKVLEIENNNVKALHRRATAYQNINCNDTSNKNSNLSYDMLALQDLYKIILLEPNNKIAQADLQKLKKKLNIEDVGKKFRMPICENTITDNDEVVEKKLSWPFKDNSSAIENLPLTYYGPSTSTFQCEPFSMAHRFFSGSTQLGEVLCKCNSNRPRQSPLCQKCGEKMCKPKPSIKAVAPKSKNEINYTKLDNEAKNLVLKKQSDEIKIIELFHNPQSNDSSALHVSDERITSSKTILEEKYNESDEKNRNITDLNNKYKLKDLDEPNDEVTSKQNDRGLNKLFDGTENCLKSSEIENVSKLKINNVENDKTNLQVGPCIVSSAYSNVSNTEDIAEINKNQIENSDNISKLANENENDAKEIEDSEINTSQKEDALENKNTNNEINTMDTKSAQNGGKQKYKKSKIKKKSKQFNEIEKKYLEPVKIVHAAKYLHPTSVEPKLVIKDSNEPQKEINISTSCQFKAFIPNKKCLSTETTKIDTSNRAFLPLVDKKPPENKQDSNANIFRNSSDQSLEGNKENISVGQMENQDKDNHYMEAVESAFEFVKKWEELKKVDDSYKKRAEIIRLIKPGELKKVIGIKLDSDMLSCLLECLKRHFLDNEPKIVTEFLKQLPKIPRFGLVNMFLAENDKNNMKKLIETIESKGFKLEDDIKNALIPAS